MANIVFIATSMDGFIADSNGNVDWLNSMPNPENLDFGFSKLMNRIDAVLMGRNTFEQVLSFNCPWPYSKKVFVLSRTLDSVPIDLEQKAEIIFGDLLDVIASLADRGFINLYIDGGKVIQNFLEKDLVDEMIITKVPIFLDKGIGLFSNNQHEELFFLDSKTSFSNGFIQYHYLKKK